MTRDEFVRGLDEQLQKVRDLFNQKNESYGQQDDVFYNFRSTAKRVFDTDVPAAMFQVLMIYMDKHLVALANRGISDQEFELRLRDIIVYSLIAIAMGREARPQE